MCVCPLFIGLSCSFMATSLAYTTALVVTFAPVVLDIPKRKIFNNLQALNGIPALLVQVCP